MSRIQTIQTKMQITKYVIEALKELGCEEKNIQITWLNTGENQEAQKIHAGAPLGAYLTRTKETEPFRVQADSDRQSYNRLEGDRDKIEMWYNACLTRDALRKEGYLVSVKEKDGRLRVTAMA